MSNNEQDELFRLLHTDMPCTECRNFEWRAYSMVIKEKQVEVKYDCAVCGHQTTRVMGRKWREVS